MKDKTLKKVFYALCAILISWFVFYVVACSVAQYKSAQALEQWQDFAIQQMQSVE